MSEPWALKAEHEWVLTKIEPIISEELWDQCNALLENRRISLARPAKRTVHLFAGLVLCECGKKMYVPTNTPKYVCTGCKNKMPIVDLEGVFLDELKGYLLSPEKVGAYLESANATLGEKARLLEALRKECERVKQDANQTYRLYLDGGLNVDQFKDRYQPLDSRKIQIEQELPRLEAEIDLLKVDGLSSEHIMSEAVDIHSRWPNLDTDQRRKIIELLVKDIVVGKGEIALKLCYIPGFEEMTNRQRTL